MVAATTDMIRVVCVKWGNKYPAEWVHRLKAMVDRYLTLEHTFVCMTDNPVEGVDCVPCAEGLPTWWSKVALFQPGLFPGLNLYLDLDVVITANIDGMVTENMAVGHVHAPDDFSYSLISPKVNIGAETRRLLGGEGTVNSSVMIWHDDAGRAVWDEFKPEKMQEVHGDQNWITQALWPHTLRLMSPDWICSYKYHVQRGEKIAPIVVFHGEPKVTGLPKSHPLHLEWAA